MEKPLIHSQMKKLIQDGIDEKNNLDAAYERESYARFERTYSGVPAERFRLLSRKQLKHRL